MSVLTSLPAELRHLVIDRLSAQAMTTLRAMGSVITDDNIEKILLKHYPHAEKLRLIFSQKYPNIPFDHLKLLSQIEQDHIKGTRASPGSLNDSDFETKDSYPLVNAKRIYEKYFTQRDTEGNEGQNDASGRPNIALTYMKKSDEQDADEKAVLTAAINNDDMIVRLILAKPGMRTPGNMWKLLYVSAANGNTDTFNYLISTIPQTRRWHLFGDKLKLEHAVSIAAAHGNLDMVKTVIDHFKERPRLEPELYETHLRLHLLFLISWEDSMLDSLKLVMSYPYEYNWDSIMNKNQGELNNLILSSVRKNQPRIFNELKQYFRFDSDSLPLSRRQQYIDNAVRNNNWDFLQSALELTSGARPTDKRYVYLMMITAAGKNRARGIMEQLIKYSHKLHNIGIDSGYLQNMIESILQEYPEEQQYALSLVQNL